MKRAGLLAIMMAGLLLAHAAVSLAPVNKTVKLTSTNLPIVWLTVDGTVNHDERITARMKIIDNGAGHLNYTDTVAHPGQHIDYEGYVGLRYRGHSSYTFSVKKPYSFRPLNRPLEAGGSWQKVSILGMPRDNTWALLAPFNDKSMIRDMLAFEISRPWMEYTPSGSYCEVVYNGIYYGVFVLAEVVSKGKYRLALDDPGEQGDELTGGYLMEVERDDEVTYLSKYWPLYSDGSIVEGTRRIRFKYKSPEYEDMTEAQLDYIHNAIDEMEAAVASLRYRDAETGECRYIDEMSFIDYQLATELGHNGDGYRLSGKFYKRRDSFDPRFKMVLWDMNLAYGNADYYDSWRTDTWVYQMNDILGPAGARELVPFWWYKLNTDPTYVEHLKERWVQYRRSNLRMDRLMETVDSLATLLTSRGAEQRNSRAYPYWGVYVWPNYFVARDFNEELAYLKRWLMTRIVWMDAQLGFVPDSPPGDVNGDGEATISDINTLIDIVLGGNAVEAILSRADIDGDGEISVADVNALIDILLGIGT